jgi:DNA-binding winged helix-turn-helix (wHTH) protein
VRVRFGEFVLDDQTRELRREGRPVALPSKALLLLEVLLRERPRAVGKDELMRRVWPGTHVTEASLSSLVAEVRAALNDTRRTPRFIRTVHGFGYAFSGDAVESAEPVGAAPAGTVYRLIWNRREITLTEGENLLGRDRDSVAWLDSPTVSRRHARIVVQGDRAYIEDLRSRNGTLVSGRRISVPTPLGNGDQIRVGALTMVFRVFEPTQTEDVEPH